MSHPAARLVAGLIVFVLVGWVLGELWTSIVGSGFPSGHATQASAFWFSLVLALRTAGAPPRVTRVAGTLALLIVLAVAASRVILGVHYPKRRGRRHTPRHGLGSVRVALRAGA